jgi:hypothetical protein
MQPPCNLDLILQQGEQPMPKTTVKGANLLPTRTVVVPLPGWHDGARTNTRGTREQNGLIKQFTCLLCLCFLNRCFVANDEVRRRVAVFL